LDLPFPFPCFFFFFFVLEVSLSRCLPPPCFSSTHFVFTLFFSYFFLERFPPGWAPALIWIPAIFSLYQPFFPNFFFLSPPVEIGALNRGFFWRHHPPPPLWRGMVDGFPLFCGVLRSPNICLFGGTPPIFSRSGLFPFPCLTFFKGGWNPPEGPLVYPFGGNFSSSYLIFALQCLFFFPFEWRGFSSCTTSFPPFPPPPK